MRRTLPLLPALALLGAAHAQTFPAVPRKGTVYDGARLLSREQAATIDALSRDFQRDTGAPIVVATLPSLDAFGAKTMGIERYAGALFDQWRIGSRAHNGGVLLVVAKADRKARIEMGRDWGHRYDAKSRSIMQGTVLPAFKRGDLGGGIVRGCQALAHLADETTASPSASPPTSFAQTYAPDAFPSEPMTSPEPDGLPFGLLCLAAPMLIVVLLVRAARRAGGATVRPPRAGGFGSQPPTYGRDDDAFAAGYVAGQMASPPVVIDASPAYDPSPSDDPSPSFDSGSSADIGGSFDSGSFDSGDSGGSGDTGGW